MTGASFGIRRALQLHGLRPLMLLLGAAMLGGGYYLVIERPRQVAQTE
ncbi:MAG: hypothetical protein ACR652_00080 [Methylocystis sp.]